MMKTCLQRCIPLWDDDAGDVFLYNDNDNDDLFLYDDDDDDVFVCHTWQIYLICHLSTLLRPVCYRGSYLILWCSSNLNICFVFKTRLNSPPAGKYCRHTVSQYIKLRKTSTLLKLGFWRYCMRGIQIVFLHNFHS